MAITIIQNLPSVTPAFADNLLVVGTDNPNAQLIKYELKMGPDVMSTQYAPVFEGQADLHLGPIYRSFLNLYDNPLDEAGITFYDPGTEEHNLLITDQLTEVIDPVAKDFGAQNQYTRRIIKSVNFDVPVSSMAPAAFCNLVDDDGYINRWILNGQKIPVMIRTFSETDYTIQKVSYPDATSTAFGTPVTNQRMAQGMKTLTGDSSIYFLTIALGNNADMKLFVDSKCYPRTKTIYWLNSFGGWDWFNGIDYEIIHRTEKLQATKYINRARNKEVMQMSMGNTQECKLFGRALNSKYYAYLKDMVASPIVFDEDGERIRILDTNVDIVREDMILEPEIRIEYLKENSLIY